MAVIAGCKTGCVISHDSYIKTLYKNTKNGSETKSYKFNPALFDIQVPFVKNKGGVPNSETVTEGDGKLVKEAHKVLYDLYAVLNDSSSPQVKNNQSAITLASNFYSQLTCHTNSCFRGGNTSVEPLVTKIGAETYLIPKKSLFYCNDIKNISNHLEGKQFDFILMDPPWWNKFIRRKRKINDKFGYNMVYDKELTNIPIKSLLCEDGIIGVWCTNAPSHINAVLVELFSAWNVKFLTQWFWLKIAKSGEPICAFSQSLKKQPYERIIFGIKATSKKDFQNMEKDKVFMSIPSAIHSHKPPLCELLKPYLPEEPKCLELFARYLLPFWTSYGNEVLKLQHMSLYTEEVETDT